MPCVDLSGPVIPPSPEPGGTRTVNVVNATQLTTALAGARPGDLIVLAPGTYAGSFKAAVSGTATQRITLYGPRTAILKGSTVTSPTVLKLDGASYWTLQGFSISTGLKGLTVWRGQQNVIDGLEVSQTGQEAIAVGRFSSSNIIQNNLVHDTGKSVHAFGEGIYIGTAESNWCNFTNCQPDTSNDNQILSNTIHTTTADLIQVGAGTSRAIVRGNTLSGAGLVTDASQPVWVLAMGNSMLVEYNTCTAALTHGMKVHRNSSSWGLNNVFRKNTMNVGSASYDAIYLESPVNGNVVYCDNGSANANDRTDAGALTNITCTA